MLLAFVYTRMSDSRTYTEDVWKYTCHGRSIVKVYSRLKNPYWCQVLFDENEMRCIDSNDGFVALIGRRHLQLATSGQ